MGPPPSTSKTGGRLSKVTLPGPRYFDHTSSTGTGTVLGGAIVALANLPSSSAHTGSASGAPFATVRSGALDSSASGPFVAGPFSASRIDGGVFFTATSLNGLML